MTDEATDIIQRLKKERDELGARVKKLEDENVEVHVLRELYGDMIFSEREIVRNGDMEKAAARATQRDNYSKRVHAERDAAVQMLEIYYELIVELHLKKYEGAQARGVASP